MHICLCRCFCRSAQGFRFLCSLFLKSRLQVWSQEFLRSAHIFVMQLNRLLFVFLCICPACSSNVIHLFPNGTRAMDSAFKQVYDHMNKTFDYGLFTKFSKAVQEGACSFLMCFICKGCTVCSHIWLSMFGLILLGKNMKTATYALSRTVVSTEP